MKLIHKVKCMIGKHEYQVTRKVSHDIAELKCLHCGKEFAINISAKALLPLDKELKDLHEYMLTGDIRLLR